MPVINGLEIILTFRYIICYNIRSDERKEIMDGDTMKQVREEHIEIRRALPADEDAVCRLWGLLLEFYQKQADPEVLRSSFRYVVEHPQKVLIFIILIEGVVTGTISLHLGHFSTWSNNWYGHLEDLVIDPAYRESGQAERLIRHAIKAARANNLSRLELNALNNNTAARRLYEKLGFNTNSVVYELPLS